MPTARLGASEAPDRAAFVVRPEILARLFAHEDGLDTASFRFAHQHTATLAAQEPPDVASFAAAKANGATLGATEAPDTAAFQIHNNKAALAATEPPDQALFLIGERHTAHLAATEAPDVAHFTAFYGNFAHMAAQERPDTSNFVFAPPPPPPCEPPYTRPLDYYLNLITSEHNQKPNYMTTVNVTINPVVTDEGYVADFPCLFDVDQAVGAWLDVVGQWIGKSRWIELPNVFFSWDIAGLGWDQANWKGPYDSDNALQRLDDFHYRLLLYATIVANHWNGSIPQAYQSWDTVFYGTGIEVVIQDWGNMTMAIGLVGPRQPDAVSTALVLSGAMDLKPEGIALKHYIFQALPGIPLFGFDGESTTIAGWDEGQWGILVTPGQGYVPGAQGGFA